MKYFLVVLLVASFFGSVQAQSDEPQGGDTRTDEKGIEQVYVPAGCFLMGITEEQAAEIEAQEPPSWMINELPLEQPQHEVCLTAGYWIDTYEATNAAWAAFVADSGYETEEYWSEDGWKWRERRRDETLPAACFDEEPDDFPRACITWWEAEAYATWRGGSIPTEAQWEFAARSPESFVYPWGNEWDAALANVVDSEEPVAVGSYPDGASWVGALDMAGNLMEWTADWLAPYDPEIKDDPVGPERGRFKPERGGWWGSNEFVARSTFRYFEDPPTYQDHHIGVRIVSPAAAE
jgi:formylglycine-generating enzyme required for sulfatase activity